MTRFISILILIFALTACSDGPVNTTQESANDLQVQTSSEFASTTSTFSLEDPDDAYNYDEVDATYQRKEAGTFNGDRLYMRTVATDFSEKDFTAELVFTLSNVGTELGANSQTTITFFGIGPGDSDSGNVYEPTGGAFLRIHAPDVVAGTNVSTWNTDGSNINHHHGTFPRITVSGEEHRAILTKVGTELTFEMDVDNDGVVDHSTTIADYTDHTDIDATNSRIFFGTSSKDLFTLSIAEASNDPTSMDECKKGGWEVFGFRNQGQCIRFVNTGKDSR